MMNFKEEALKIKDEIINIRRDFHAHPELGFEEYRTSAKIKEFLDKENIPYKEVAGTGVCAIIKGKYAGKTIALRSDMDALPINEKNTCDYASKESGKMHACGHDGHLAILLGAAKILNKYKEQLKGNIKLLFEPAEETVGGASYMIKEGVLENPYVDAVLGLHVTEDLDVGKIKVKNGVVNAASNPFTITVKGKGGHGAAPHATIDPIVMASHLVLALQPIVSREISPANPAVITVGSIHGGSAQNIIPDEVQLRGIIRTMTKEDREYATKRLEEVVKGITTTFRGKYSIDIEESYPCLYNDDTMVELLRENAKKVINEENVTIQKSASMGVESFAYFANERPAVFYFLGARNSEKGIVSPAHNALFNIDEDCIPIGIAIQCQTAFDYLTRE